MPPRCRCARYENTQQIGGVIFLRVLRMPRGEGAGGEGPVFKCLCLCLRAYGLHVRLFLCMLMCLLMCMLLLLTRKSPPTL